jgi:hypothetical protein
MSEIGETSIKPIAQIRHSNRDRPGRRFRTHRRVIEQRTTVASEIELSPYSAATFSSSFGARLPMSLLDRYRW